MWGLIVTALFLVVAGFILLHLVLPLLHGMITLLVFGVILLVLFAIAKALWRAVFGSPESCRETRTRDYFDLRYEYMKERMDDLDRMFSRWRARNG